MAGFPLSSMSSSSSLVVVRPAVSRGHSEPGLCQGGRRQPGPAPRPHPLSLLISSCLWMRPLQRSR